MQEKVCRHCDITKPLEFFSKNKGGKFGRHSKCKECVRIYGKLHHNKHKSDINAKHREYYNNNKEKVLERCKQYRLENRDKKLAYERQWRQNNKHIKTAQSNKRRALKTQATPELSVFEVQGIKALYLISSILGNSCGEPFHVDHIRPISKGGLHCLDNLQVITAAENLSKGAKYEC